MKLIMTNDVSNFVVKEMKYVRTRGISLSEIPARYIKRDVKK